MVRHANGRSVMDKATDFFASTRKFTEEHASQAKTFIEERPFLTALLGLGAGVLVGLFFSRRVPKVELVVRSKGKAG